MSKIWYVASMGSDPFNQGLVADENTGESIAVTYKAENAPIVAAAPELLEMLKTLSDSLYEAIDLTDENKNYNRRWANDWQKARAVIEKAGG